MIADLRERAAGLDRKRVYTAVSALLIAGAAGHFMQRTANLPGADAPAIAASVPAAATMTGPTILPPAGAEASNVVAEASAVAPSLPGQEEISAAPAVDDVTEPRIAEMPTLDEAEDTASIAAASEPGDPAAAFGVEPAEPIEVTRSTGTPILEVPSDAGRAPTEDFVIAAALDGDREENTEFQIAALDDAGLVEVPEVSLAEPAIPACDVSFSVQAEAGALVLLAVEAPCNGGADVDFVHAGLHFSEQLSPDGSLLVQVPAMAAKAVFQARFPDGQNSFAETDVPDFTDFERIAVVWQGATGLQLHALENGANYGEPGHVWAEQPGETSAAVEGTGGFVSVLGSTADGYAADVYTYPAGLMLDNAGPEVSIEAQVMENTCGTKIVGSILRTNPIGTPNIEDLSIAVPGCDTVGEYLVLKNLPQDLKLARN